MKPSAMEALALWDEGKKVAAIEVESEGSSQNDIYAVAFEFLRRHKQMEDDAGAIVASDWMSGIAPASQHETVVGAIRELRNFAALSDREFDAAASVAAVAVVKGWTVMLGQHEHPSIRWIEVQKPKPAASSA